MIGELIYTNGNFFKVLIFYSYIIKLYVSRIESCNEPSNKFGVNLVLSIIVVIKPNN